MKWTFSTGSWDDTYDYMEGISITNQDDTPLYLNNTSANNGVRVDDTDDKTWTIGNHESGTADVLYMWCNGRYCGVYNNADWRSYTTYDATNYTAATGSSKILLFKETDLRTYSNYETNCCEAPASALSITSANSVATGGTVSLTSTGGNGGTVTWSVVNGTGSATVAGTTLTAGSIGTVTVKAHQDANTVLGTEYCAQDAEQAFTVVSSTVNVTGVEVSPTSKAIVPGETFDITPTISPSNATDKSVSWTSSASDKASVSSGTVTGVAAGTATITCTTTDGSYTATTAVTVYGVTMQALDEDGNAIAVGGPGTPSRTGASISPAADAANYKFKQWTISGAELGSAATTKGNSITNPTGNVTVTAVYYLPRTVTWLVNGDEWKPYTDKGSGTNGTAVVTRGVAWSTLTLPTDPDPLNDEGCGQKFMGWVAVPITGELDKDDDAAAITALDIMTSANQSTKTGAGHNVNNNITFYAVFADYVE